MRLGPPNGSAISGFPTRVVPVRCTPTLPAIRSACAHPVCEKPGRVPGRRPQGAGGYVADRRRKGPALPPRVESSTSGTVAGVLEFGGEQRAPARAALPGHGAVANSTTPTSSPPTSAALAPVQSRPVALELFRAEWHLLEISRYAQPRSRCEPSYTPPTWPTTANSQQMMLHLDFNVDDLEAAHAHAVAAGATPATWQPQLQVRVSMARVCKPAPMSTCRYRPRTQPPTIVFIQEPARDWRRLRLGAQRSTVVIPAASPTRLSHAEGERTFSMLVMFDLVQPVVDAADPGQDAASDHLGLSIVGSDHIWYQGATLDRVLHGVCDPLRRPCPLS
jgi:Glyoxalase-like domain